MAYHYLPENYVWLDADFIPCAHLCRYCSIYSRGERFAVKFSFERFYALRARFEEWGALNGFEVNSTVQNSDDITDKLAKFLDQTIGPVGSRANPADPRESKVRIGMVRTGGARFRSDDEIRAWLSRWRHAGATVVHGSFAGHREAHDWWNNRRGDYDFLMRIQQIAIEMGFQISQAVYLMRNAIPDLARVFDDLERLPAQPTDRWVLPVSYTGRARSRTAESQRLTESDRDTLEKTGLDLTFDKNHSSWHRVELKSERERLPELMANPPEARGWGLGLHVDDGNIEYLESTPCNEVAENLRRRVDAAYSAIPSHEELITRYADPDGTKIYGIPQDMDVLWLDRFLKRNPITFERSLTHLH